MTIKTVSSFRTRPGLGFRWIALALLLAACPASLHAINQNRVFLHPKVKTHEKTLRSLVLIPATAKAGALGKVPTDKVEDAENVGREVGALIADAFSQNGWQVDKDTFAEASVAEDAKVRNAVAFLRERHINILREIASEPKAVTKGKVTFGPNVAALGANPKADALLLVDANSLAVSDGVGRLLVAASLGRARGTLKKGPMRWARATLVDAETGDVLCFLYLGDLRDASLAKTLSKIPH